MSTASPPKNKRNRKKAASPVATPRHNTKTNKSASSPDWMKKAYPDGFNWGIIGWVVLLHLGACAAPFFFSWEGLALVFVLHWITGGLGICLGYHRLFTHSSFNTWGPIRFALAVIGGMAGEGSAIDWVADHRKHHALSDKEGDPHSPHDGPWWSHMLWFAGHKPAAVHEAKVLRWAPDLQRDWWMRLAGSMFLPSHFALSGLLLAAGYWYGGWYMAVSFLVYAQFLRVIFVLHSTWFVNSASHMWGYTNYETTDDSRNNWWVAILTYGEGWHNNHHAYPRMANHGHRWWEFDATYNTVRLMRLCGLAWDVVDYKRAADKAA